jgi:hypothetical protein
MKINERMSKEHMEKVMMLYKDLPDPNSLDHGLYDALKETLNRVGGGDSPLPNGVIMATLQSFVLMLCESCVEWTEEQEYETIQENYK